MCHFITATLPRNTDVSCAALIFDRHKLSFNQIANPHLVEQFEAGTIHIFTTTSHCDCGTALGVLRGKDESDESNYERELKKFRKQGWNETKIQRWLEQKLHTQLKHEREDETTTRARTPEAARWIDFISDVLKSKCSSKIGLLLHRYSGGIDSERIKILRKEKVKLDDLIPVYLMQIEEDVLYEFVV